jgi:hypothetical protein
LDVDLGLGGRVARDRVFVFVFVVFAFAFAFVFVFVCVCVLVVGICHDAMPPGGGVETDHGRTPQSAGHIAGHLQTVVDSLRQSEAIWCFGRRAE